MTAMCRGSFSGGKSSSDSGLGIEDMEDSSIVLCILLPLSIILCEYRLLAVGAYGYDFHGDADYLAQPVEISPRVGGQIAKAADIADFHLPAGQGLVNRHNTAQIVYVTGEIGRFAAVQFISGANPDLRQLAEHVQQHYTQCIHSAKACGIADGYGVEPAATPRTPGDGPVFVAAVANVLAGGVILFGGEGAAADAGSIRLDNADYLGDVSAGHARPGRHAHARTVARW